MAKRAYVVLGLAQCGETRWQREGRLQGAADLPLSDSGRAAVRAARALLVGRRPALVAHPPDEAATETAQLLAETVGARPRTVPDLADPRLGLLEGLLVSDFQERHRRRARQWVDDPLALSPPEGEPIGDACGRVLEAVGRLVRKARGGGVLLVLHPMALGLVRCWLEERPPRLWRALLDEGPRVVHYTLAPPVAEALRADAEG